MGETLRMQDTLIRKDLLEILACPACESRPAVDIKDGAVHCPECGRLYPIENGVPIMLVEKAVQPERIAEQGE
jgi:uncharacterized protein